jgi:hypothetical protein
MKREFIWCILKLLNRIMDVDPSHPVVVVFEGNNRVEYQRSGDPQKEVRQFGVRGGCGR